MASTTVSTDLSIKPFNETYRVYVIVDPTNGKIVEEYTKYTTAGKDNGAWDSLDKKEVVVKDENGNPKKDVEGNVIKAKYVTAIEQTIRGYKVGSEAGFAELVPDTEERINIINQALAAKLNRKLGATFKELNEDGTNVAFEPVELFDTVDLLRDPTKRKNLSAVEKQLRALKVAFPMLNEQQLLATIQALMSSGQLEPETEEVEA